MADVVKVEYAAEAAKYDSFWTTGNPFVRIDSELFVSALSAAPGASVLDLAGGSGIKARFAIDAGAVAVDIVDISQEMMLVGQEAEASLNRDVIRWFEADISKPLDHLPLRPQYDIVMAHWPLDHADSMAVLEGMLQNITSYLKPGGRFFGVRCCDPRAPAMVSGELGVVFKDFEEIPGGLKFRYAFNDFGSDIEATSMEATYSGSTEIYEKFGLVDVQTEPYENAQVVKENPKMWESFLKQPGLAMVKATKKL
ncbi:S-adenosyl-L-methionine-dependent methyltransferase [Hypoxylon argillaceum]|nr:S-adenosyl-L-methionine-dependent methyltransferase [Hypoxylon argillaceum]KAI1156774.1 S-adenosyl-L-methionine-dependent methyltransferase [Nemania diffusa]